ncbi:MAG: trypsin-like serine protease [Neisseriaceae bacterium]
MKRRVAVTARHCAEVAMESNVTITFDETPQFIRESGVTKNVILTEPSFSGKAYYIDKYNYFLDGDFAVVILDSPVSEQIVPLPAQLPNIGQASSVFKQRVTMTGYGVIVWGNSHSVGLDEAADTGHGVLIGDRAKMTITMPVLSYTNINLMTQMNYALGQDTSCNGDSGSGEVIEVDLASNTPSILLAVTSSSDLNCRAMQNNSRIDRKSFYDLLSNTLQKY